MQLGELMLAKDDIKTSLAIPVHVSSLWTAWMHSFPVCIVLSSMLEMTLRFARFHADSLRIQEFQDELQTGKMYVMGPDR